MKPRHIIEELENIYINEPLSPGDTISHTSANICVSLGWATRNIKGDFVITRSGINVINQIINAIKEYK